MTVYSDLVGHTFTNVVQHGEDEILFIRDDDKRFKFYHEQDCCESVYIADVNGDWDDLIGSPLLVAEGREQEGETEPGSWEDSSTWTFYTFRTVKGSVDVRWVGTSNGYYSESVDFREVKNG